MEVPARIAGTSIVYRQTLDSNAVGDCATALDGAAPF